MRPADWETLVELAWLEELGHDDDYIRGELGAPPHVLAKMRAHPSWPDAQTQAKKTLEKRTMGAARRTVLQAVEAGDAITARWVLQRAGNIFGRQDPSKLEEETELDFGSMTEEELQEVIARESAATSES